MSIHNMPWTPPLCNKHFSSLDKNHPYSCTVYKSNPSFPFLIFPDNFLYKLRALEIKDIQYLSKPSGTARCRLVECLSMHPSL